MSLQVQDCSLPGVKLIRPKSFADERGFFRETYRKPLHRQMGIDCDFVQDNHSYSCRGTLRGMHFQRSPGQSKLVSVVRGRVFDVVVDVRRGSPTYGKWEGVYLDGERGEQLFIPVGYAHGFCVVSEDAHLWYKVSSVYDAKEEMGFCFNDPDVGIVWPLENPVLSERDRTCPRLSEVAL